MPSLFRTAAAWIALTGAPGPGPAQPGAPAPEWFPDFPPTDAAGNRYRLGVSGLLIRSGLVLGTLLLFPSLLYAVRSGKTGLVVADVAVYLVFLSLYFLNRRRPRLSAGGLVVLGLAFGTYLLAANGPSAAGTVWMGASVTLASVLFGTAGGALTAGLVGAFFLAVIFAASRGLLAWHADFAFLVILGLNVLVLSLVAGLAASYVARSLEREAAERLGAERKAEFYRDFDGRTGLPNRERFLRELERVLVPASRRGRILSVLAVGIHRPGLLFDEFGHVLGEAAIAGAGIRLREAFREDDVVARTTSPSSCPRLFPPSTDRWIRETVEFPSRPPSAWPYTPTTGKRRTS